MVVLSHHAGGTLGRPNYSYEKRRKELAKQKKKEEKRLKRARRKGIEPESSSPPVPGEPKPTT